MNKKIEINWSGRSHNYTKKETNFLIEIIKKADPLTQGKYLKQFEDIETPWFIDLYCDDQKQREELKLYLNSKNIETRYSYPSLSSQTYLKETKKTKLSFSEEISESILWLPSSTNLTNEDIKYVSNEVNNFFNN